MVARLSSYIIFLKIFFLCVSIVFLLRAATMPLHSNISSGTESKIFTVERNAPDLQQTIQSIDAYLDTVTGQAIGLATSLSGHGSTLLLPATTDYALYKTYLHSISSLSDAGGSKSDNSLPLPPDSSIAEDSSSYGAGFVLTLLLALFL